MSETKTILVCDDDPDFQLQQKLQLEAAGYTVGVADSAEHGMEQLEAVKPDLCIFDLMMEDDDAGFMLCHEAKKMNPDLPIIMVTGVAAETGIGFDATTEEERRWIKADVLLAKPIRFEQLLSEVKRLLDEE